MVRYIICFSGNLICQNTPNLAKTGSFKLFDLLQKVGMEFSVASNCCDCVFDHIMLLILGKFAIEVVGIDCGHEDDSVVID